MARGPPSAQAYLLLTRRTQCRSLLPLPPALRGELPGSSDSHPRLRNVPPCQNTKRHSSEALRAGTGPYPSWLVSGHSLCGKTGKTWSGSRRREGETAVTHLPWIPNDPGFLWPEAETGCLDPGVGWGQWVSCHQLRKS